MGMAAATAAGEAAELEAVRYGLAFIAGMDGWEGPAARAFERTALNLSVTARTCERHVHQADLAVQAMEAEANANGSWGWLH